MENRTALPDLIKAITIMGAVSLPTVLLAAPEIVTPPTNQTVTAGLPLQMSVVAKSSLPLTYQWMLTRDSVTPRTANVPNATNSVLVVSNTLTTSAGLYSVKVSDSSGSVTSVEAHVRVVSLQFFSTNQMKLEVWNNVRNTAFRVEMTTNFTNTLSTFTAIDVLSALWILPRNLPHLFFRTRPLPMP